MGSDLLYLHNIIMDKHNNKKKKIELKKFILLYGVPLVIFIIILISIIFIVYPTYNNVNAYNREISYYNNKNITLNSEINVLQNYSSKKGEAQLKTYLNKLNNIIPNQLQFVLTSAQVKSLGNNAGLTFKNLSTAQLPTSFKKTVSVPGLSPNVTVNNVDISFNGNYSQLKQYISSLMSDKILFVIPNLIYKGNILGNNLSNINNAKMTLKVTFFSSSDSSNYNYAGGLVSQKSLNKLLLNFK